MFKVDFDKEMNIKEEIKHSEEKPNVSPIPYFIIVQISALFFSFMDLSLFNIIINCMLSAILFGIPVSLFLKDERRIKNRAKNNLEQVAKTLSSNNIHTNANKLSQSVIVEINNKNTREISINEEYDEKEELNEDRYYLFFDKNDDLQGILERKNTITENNDKIRSKQFYILESQDIHELEAIIPKVKKLTRNLKR